jgi:hypothetical protein
MGLLMTKLFVSFESGRRRPLHISKPKSQRSGQSACFPAVDTARKLAISWRAKTRFSASIGSSQFWSFLMPYGIELWKSDHCGLKP